jgi:hypothetical protein
MNKRSKALNATKADAQAWLVDKELEQYELGYDAGKAIMEQQLATVTSERDALREVMSAANAVVSGLHLGGVDSWDIKKYERLRKIALAQKGGE